MPPKRRKDRVHDITAIEKIQRSAVGLSFDALVHDEKTVDAVVRNPTVIGDAAQHIPTDIQARSSAILRTDAKRSPPRGPSSPSEGALTGATAVRQDD